MPMISFTMQISIFHFHVPYFLWIFLPLSVGCFLSPRSFNSLEGPLIRKPSSLPITFDGVGFISTSTIAPTTYLRSRALIAFVIVVEFMVDQHLFLLETLTQVNNNTFLFQQHLKMICDLLPLPPPACLLPFEQFIGQQMVQLQIPSWNVCTIITFLGCSPMGYLRPIMLEFYHVLAQRWVFGL